MATKSIRNNSQAKPWEKAELPNKHPELHHYTDRKGLKGILSSQTLYATNFANLSDASEISVLRRPWLEALSSRLKPYLVEWRRNSISKKIEIDRFGGIAAAANHLAKIFVDGNYAALFDGKKKTPLAEPYVCSFCSHKADHEYEKANGILSQWRGYGGEGRFALVFDSNKLSEDLKLEWERFNYSALLIEEVIYLNAVEDLVAVNKFITLIDKSCDIVFGVIEKKGIGAMVGMTEQLFEPLITMATILKHRAFMEEREVRVVAIPFSNQAIAERSGNVSVKIIDSREIKKVHEFNGRRVVHLFENSKRRLPLTRIIVGPGREQKEDVMFAKSLVENKIRVDISNTPFIH